MYSVVLIQTKVPVFEVIDFGDHGVGRSVHFCLVIPPAVMVHPKFINVETIYVD
jgi:hypothetical protein